jgi:hypothetical protein
VQEVTRWETVQGGQPVPILGIHLLLLLRIIGEAKEEAQERRQALLEIQIEERKGRNTEPGTPP